MSRRIKFWVVTHGIAILGKDAEVGGIAKPTDSGAAAKPTGSGQSSPKRGRAAGGRGRGALLSLQSQALLMVCVVFAYTSSRLPWWGSVAGNSVEGVLKTEG